jgi:hypothetical protein
MISDDGRDMSDNTIFSHVEQDYRQTCQLGARHVVQQQEMSDDVIEDSVLCVLVC